MTSVRFKFAWLDSAPARNGAEESTFAELSIQVGDATVTSVLERPKQYREHVVVPLLSVAEWLVSNWWHLWYEVADTGEPRPGFESRHDLAHAGDGFLLPKLEMTASAERMHLQWAKWKPQHARIEFIEEGQAVVDREALESEFRALIEAVLERLRALPGRTAAGEFLSKDWEAINAVDDEETEFAQAAALLGIDPFNVQDSVANAIVEFWETSPPSIRQEALASASEESLSRTSKWLNDSLGSLEESDHGAEWAGIRNATPTDLSLAPWTRGYTLADSVRHRLNVGDGRFDFDPSGSLALPNFVLKPPSGRIQGLVAANAPTCVTAPRSETGKRFLLARALGDYIGRTEPGPPAFSVPSQPIAKRSPEHSQPSSSHLPIRSGHGSKTSNPRRRRSTNSGSSSESRAK